MNSEIPRFRVLVAASAQGRELEKVKKDQRPSHHTFVGALPQLLVVRGLLNQIKDGDSQRSVGQWVGLGVDLHFFILRKCARNIGKCGDRAHRATNEDIRRMQLRKNRKTKTKTAPSGASGASGVHDRRKRVPRVEEPLHIALIGIMTTKHAAKGRMDPRTAIVRA